MLMSQFPPNELLAEVSEDQYQEDDTTDGPLGGAMMSPILSPGESQSRSQDEPRNPRTIGQPCQGQSQGASPRQQTGGSQLDDSILGMLSGSFPVEKEPSNAQSGSAGQTTPTPASPPTQTVNDSAQRLAAADESEVNESLLGMLSGSFPAQPTNPASKTAAKATAFPGAAEQTPVRGSQPSQAGVMEIKVYEDKELASFKVLSEEVSYKASGFSPMRLTPSNGGNEPCVVAAPTISISILLRVTFGGGRKEVSRHCPSSCLCLVQPFYVVPFTQCGTSCVFGGWDPFSGPVHASSLGTPAS